MSTSLARRRDALRAMGISVWVRRGQTSVGHAERNDTTPSPSAGSESVAALTTGAGGVAAMGWGELAGAVSACELCGLSQTRNRTVFGAGDRQADILIVGEAPGADEDRQGEPFVGRAGQLLNAMLEAIGLQRQQVYITNILKCRPPRNRDPQASEMACCEPYLKRQIALLQPKVVLASGRIAAQSLLGTTQAIGRLRGQLHQYADTGVPLIATYHPAYLLRSPAAKAKSWQDLKMLRAQLAT